MFYERFLELCNKKGLSPAAAAREIGLSNATTTHWSQGTNPTQASTLKVAKYFGVSTEYLLGKAEKGNATVEYAVASKENSDREGFQFDRFYDLCKAQGKKQTYLYDLVGFPSKAGSNLRRTKKVKPEILEIWAKELHTSAAYLNGETDDPSAPEEQQEVEVALEAPQKGKEKGPAAESHEVTENDIKYALFGGDATDAQFEEVKSFARFVKERDENGQGK